VEFHQSPLFYIGPFGVTSAMVTMFAITVGLTLFSYLATRKLQQRPGKLQNFVEKCVEMLRNFISGIIGDKHTDRYFAYLATLFIFILISNYSGLLPFSGILPGFAAPTSTINIPAALAISTFLVTQYSGIRQHGIRYLQHFTKPFFFLFPLLLLESIIRPVTLTLRLFGTTYGDETVIHQIFSILPLGIPVVMQVLTLLLCSIQAMIFVLLSGIFISESLEEAE